MSQEINDKNIFKLIDLLLKGDLYKSNRDSFAQFIEEIIYKELIDGQNIFSERYKNNKIYRHRFQFENIGLKPPINENNDEFGVMGPKWDGLAARIDYHGVHHASKTLGSMTCPSGCNRGATLEMQVKSEAWAATVKEGKLSQQNFWFMMENQFSPRVAFVIGVSMASFDTLLD